MTANISTTDAVLKAISLRKLIQGDADTSADLLEACVKVGFFYLDYRDYQSGATGEQFDHLFAISENLFALPQEEKLRWSADKEHGSDMVVGYKAAGVSNGPLKGKKDGFEGFMIFEHPLSQITDTASTDVPEPLKAEIDLLKRAMTTLHDIGAVILFSLSKSLALQGESAFEFSHWKTEASTTALGFLKYLPYQPDQEKIGHIAHTDAGSLSMVFTEVGGLQVLMPDTDEWTFIAPKSGHAVVNVGDSLTFLSGGLLRSSLHRVVPHSETSDRIKYTNVYLMRPETDATFKDPEGRVWKSIDWCDKKFAVFRAPASEQRQGSVLTQRSGYTGY